MKDEQLTAELETMIEEIRGGRDVSITLCRNLLGGQQYARFEWPRYGGNGRALKPEKALSAVIVGHHADTLRMLAERLS